MPLYKKESQDPWWGQRPSPVLISQEDVTYLCSSASELHNIEKCHLQLPKPAELKPTGLFGDFSIEKSLHIDSYGYILARIECFQKMYLSTILNL